MKRSKYMHKYYSSSTNYYIYFFTLPQKGQIEAINYSNSLISSIYVFLAQLAHFVCVPKSFSDVGSNDHLM